MTPLPWPPASRCILMVFLPWGLDGAAVDELMIQKRVAVIRSSAAISFDVFWGLGSAERRAGALSAL